MKSFKNGKITVNDRSVKINGLLGMSEVVQREDIETVHSMGNVFIAIINIIFIIGIFKGVKMLQGNKLVTIKKYNGKEVAFWMHSSEVEEFKSYL